MTEFAAQEIPTHLYVGKREACIAEVSGRVEIYSGKYLVCPIGEGSWDCEGVATKKDMAALIRKYRAFYPHIIIVRI